ncbi:MAG: insulinase family protein [Candidatus Abawacabacteria bacterium]|nr:insulinase family protein [Candidatus Abawacabacteria bacterium]
MYQCTNLPNGLRIISGHLPQTEVATVLVLVGTGSRFETRDINGVSHFLEHLFFKGAKKYPDTRAVSEAVDGVGGEFNAFTGKDYTGYYVRAAKEHVGLACDVISDMLLHATFKEEEIERERGVILEEINMYEDDPRSKVAESFEEQLFGDQPLGWNIAGPKDVIKRVSREEIMNYRSRTYVPQNIVVVVTGSIEHAQVVTLVQRYFSFTNDGPVPQPEAFKSHKANRKLIIHRKTEQAHFWLGTQAYDRYHKDRFALRVLRTILGGGMSSRLFLSVRERQGLCYYIAASSDDYADTGNFAAFAGVDLLRVNQALRAVEKEFALISEEKVNEAELHKAKSYIKGKMVMGLEDSENVANMLAHQQLFYNRFFTLDEQKTLIDSVTAEDIQRVSQDLLKPENLSLALIGPFEDKDIEF